jgi:quercetin dioxygenase-like cupin family protein
MDGGAVKPLDLRNRRVAPILGYESVRAASAALADGAGEAHLHCVRFEPGGSIGRHQAAFGQLFLALEGSGWVSGGDGRRVEIAAGQGAWIAPSGTPRAARRA